MCSELTFGERLQDIRKTKGLTQKQVADAIGLAPQTIGGYENGISFPDRDTLIRLSNFFNVTLDYLLARIDFNAKNIALEQAFVEYEGKSISIGRLIEMQSSFNVESRLWLFDLLNVLIKGGKLKT